MRVGLLCIVLLIAAIGKVNAETLDIIGNSVYSAYAEL